MNWWQVPMKVADLQEKRDVYALIWLTLIITPFPAGDWVLLACNFLLRTDRKTNEAEQKLVSNISIQKRTHEQFDFLEYVTWRILGTWVLLQRRYLVSKRGLPATLLMGLNVQSNLLRLIGDGGKWGGGDGYLCPITYSLNCHHQNDSALRRAAAWDILIFH